MRALRTLLLGLSSTALWPAYLLLSAYAARQAPWPRSFAIASASVLACLALATLASSLARWLLRPGGLGRNDPAVPARGGPPAPAAVLALVLAAVRAPGPRHAAQSRADRPEGRPVSAPAVCQLLVLGFELTVWGVVFRLVRGRSALVQWLSEHHERLGWLGRHRRLAAGAVLAAIGARDRARRAGLQLHRAAAGVGAGQTLVLIGFCYGLYRMILHAIDLHAWRWIDVGHAQGPSTESRRRRERRLDRARRPGGPAPTADGLPGAAVRSLSRGLDLERRPGTVPRAGQATARVERADQGWRSRQCDGGRRHHGRDHPADHHRRLAAPEHASSRSRSSPGCPTTPASGSRW